MKLWNLTVCVLLLLGCSSFKFLPKSTDDVTFVQDTDGSFVDGDFEIADLFPNVGVELALKAARAGLLYADFEIVEAQTEKNVVFGKHRMTAFTWDYSAGVYVKETAEGTWIKVIVDGDSSRDDWAKRAYTGIRLFIESSHRSFGSSDDLRGSQERALDQ